MEGRYGRTTQITNLQRDTIVPSLKLNLGQAKNNIAPRNATGFRTVLKITKIEIRKVSNIQYRPIARNYINLDSYIPT